MEPTRTKIYRKEWLLTAWYPNRHLPTCCTTGTVLVLKLELKNGFTKIIELTFQAWLQSTDTEIGAGWPGTIPESNDDLEEDNSNCDDPI